MLLCHSNPTTPSPIMKRKIALSFIIYEKENSYIIYHLSFII